MFWPAKYYASPVHIPYGRRVKRSVYTQQCLPIYTSVASKNAGVWREKIPVKTPFLILIKNENSLFLIHVTSAKTMENHCCHLCTKNLNFDRLWSYWVFSLGQCKKKNWKNGKNRRKKCKILWWKNEHKLRKWTKDVFPQVKICCLHNQIFIGITGSGVLVKG